MCGVVLHVPLLFPLTKVINFYLSLVMERSSGEAAGLKVYSFSTFFFPKLRDGGGRQVGGHAAVKRWTKAVDLFLYDLILVPLHLGVHWAMAVSQTHNDYTFIICCHVLFFLFSWWFLTYSVAVLLIVLFSRFKVCLNSFSCLLSLSFQVIDFKSKTVKSYDSMGQRHNDICSLLLWVLIVLLCLSYLAIINAFPYIALYSCIANGIIALIVQTLP